MFKIALNFLPFLNPFTSTRHRHSSEFRSISLFTFFFQQTIYGVVCFLCICVCCFVVFSFVNVYKWYHLIYVILQLAIFSLSIVFLMSICCFVYMIWFILFKALYYYISLYGMSPFPTHGQ